MAFIHDYMADPDLLPIKWWECEDFSWFVYENNWVQVTDNAEGCSYSMNMQQVRHALVECLIDYCDEVDEESGEPLLSVEGAQWLADRILLTATPLGICCFVKNYKET